MMIAVLLYAIYIVKQCFSGENLNIYAGKQKGFIRSTAGIPNLPCIYICNYLRSSIRRHMYLKLAHPLRVHHIFFKF